MLCAHPFVGVKYGIVKRNSCPTDEAKWTNTDIESIAECNAAAKFLKLSDTTAQHDGQRHGNSKDPPGCYFEGGKLKFNRKDGSGIFPNNGYCTEKQWCLCNGIGAWRTLVFLFACLGRHFAAKKMIPENLP